MSGLIENTLETGLKPPAKRKVGVQAYLHSDHIIHLTMKKLLKRAAVKVLRQCHSTGRQVNPPLIFFGKLLHQTLIFLRALFVIQIVTGSVQLVINIQGALVRLFHKPLCKIILLNK